MLSSLIIGLLVAPTISLPASTASFRAGDYEACALGLGCLRPRFLSNQPDYFFRKAVSEFQCMNRKAAEDACDWLLDEFTQEVPRRYRVLAFLMKEDMQHWGAPKELGDLSRRMGDVGRRLALAKGGPETQRRQRALLEDLDKKIAALEEARKKAEELPVAPGANNPAQPLPDSTLPQDVAGKGKVDIKKLRELAAVWGKLPEKERARAMLDLTRNLPARHRNLVERYLISISIRTAP